MTKMTPPLLHLNNNLTISSIGEGDGGSGRKIVYKLTIFLSSSSCCRVLMFTHIRWKSLSDRKNTAWRENRDNDNDIIKKLDCTLEISLNLKFFVVAFCEFHVKYMNTFNKLFNLSSFYNICYLLHSCYFL